MLTGRTQYIVMSVKKKLHQVVKGINQKLQQTMIFVRNALSY